MNKTIEFYFDFGSPTAYLAHTQLKSIANKHNADLIYEPMLLCAVLKATKNSTPALVPAKGRYLMTQDLPRFIKRYRVKFKMNSFFPINTTTLMRGCFAAKELGVFEHYVDTVYDAMWTKSVNMGDETVFVNILNEAGINGEKILSLIQTDSIKDALKVNTHKAIDKGAFGAPTMFIGEDMYFGQDRLEFIEAALSHK
mgnify:CR=1 FL=1